MRHTKDENPRWWHVRHPLQPEPPNNEFFVFAVEKGPRENAHDFLELIGSAPADYTPIFRNQSFIIWGYRRNYQARERHRPGSLLLI
jgi:hypothetical protein